MKVELKKLEIHKKSNEKLNLPIYVLSCDSNCSDDERKDVYTTEFVWPSKDKPSTCTSLKPIHKHQQYSIKLTFDVAKCDRFFDELLKNGNIILSHAIVPLDELKRHAYCKWHNSFSHVTNYCNVFWR